MPGTFEAPLNQENSDPVSDLLYTTNFAFLGLHEAAAATGNAAVLSASPADVKLKLEQWGVTLADKRSVVLALAQALAGVAGREDDARQLLYMFVASYNGAAAAELAGVAPHAARLAQHASTATSSIVSGRHGAAPATPGGGEGGGAADGSNSTYATTESM